MVQCSFIMYAMPSESEALKGTLKNEDIQVIQVNKPLT